MKFFLQHDPGLNVSAKNNHHETPLHVAAERGYGAGVTFLLAQGADVNDTYENFKCDKVTPLSLAAHNPSRETLNALILCERTDLNNEELYDEETLEKLGQPESLSLLNLEAMMKFENIMFPKLVRKMVDVLESGELPQGYSYQKHFR